MRSINSWIVGAGVCVATLFVSAASIVPASFNYQGVLRDGSGNTLTEGDTLMEFRLYNVATGGSFLWGREYNVLLSTNGLFNVALADANGSGLEPIKTTLLPDVIAAHPALYLGLTVSGSTEISPRQQLLSVPYALLAGDVKQASNDFSVGGALTVTSGINASGGAVQADHVQLSKKDGPNATLGLNAAGTLEVVNFEVTGNLNVSQKMIAGSIEADSLSAGSIDTASLSAGVITGPTEIQGETQLFSRNSETNSWSEKRYGTLSDIEFPEADSDGFFILNLNLYFNTEGDNEKNTADVKISFSGAGIDRDFNVMLQAGDLGGGKGKLAKTDIVSLPVLKGETVTMTMTFEREGYSYVRYKHMFIPFGTTK